MGKQIINIGAAPNDGTGDPLRTAFDKANDNFTELYDADTALDGRIDALEGTVGSVVDNDTTMAGDSTTIAPSQHAVREYVAAKVTGLLQNKGPIDCSVNPSYPAADDGDAYRVSVAGRIGGGAGPQVDVGDVIIASADNLGGNHAAVGANWYILEHNSLAAVGYTDAQARSAVGRWQQFFITGTPSASEILAIDVAEQPYTIPANLAGWKVAKMPGGANPGATFDIVIKNNGTTIATISISAAGGVTLTTVGGSSKAIAENDVVSWHGPATADTGIANWAFNAKGDL